MNETQEAATVQAPAPAPKPPVPKRRRGKKWLIPAILVLALAVGGGVFVYLQQQATLAAAAYTDYTVGWGEIAEVITESSVLEPKEARTVSSLVSGTVLQADFEKGQRVAEGDLLYVMDDRDAQKALEQAEVSLQRARQTYGQAAQRVEELTLTAPDRGLVTAVNVKNGDLVAPGVTVANLVDPDALSLTLPFLEGDAAGIYEGQSALVTLTATGETLAGLVHRVATGATVGGAGVRLVNVVIHFENPGAVSPGQQATAQAGDYACHQSGPVAYRSEYAVRAKWPGEVSGLTVIAGDRVSAGAVVARLVDSDAQTARENAALAVTEAENAVRRGREALANYQILAPIAGTVVDKTVDAGDKLSATSLGGLAQVADLTELRFPLDVDEMDVASIRPGQRVRVTADACPGEEYFGAVESVDPMGAASGGVTTFAVWVGVTDYGALRPGMNVEAGIITARAENVLTVPRRAISEEGAVMVKVGAGYQRVPVETGLSAGGMVEIVSGISAGDIVGLP